MPRQVSPICLAQAYPDAAILPKIPVEGTLAVGPTILAYVRPGKAATADIAGSAASAIAGTSVATVPRLGIAELSPTILPCPFRNLQPKFGHVEVELVGGEVVAQAEALEGASVTIRIDSAVAAARAGTTTSASIKDREGAAFIGLTLTAGASQLDIDS